MQCVLKTMSLVLAAMLYLLPAAPSVAGTGTTAPAGFVARIDLDGAIGPASAEYVHDALARAHREGADAVIMQLDTPGGLSTSMQDIIRDILASPVPVIAYVAPDGARAASAGTYIVYASPLAAMAPATHLGAATPVTLGGSTPLPMPARPASSPAPAASSAAPAKAQEQGGSAESRKQLNDAIAYIRSLAQLRGRNAQWAEQAVRGAATLTAREALEQHVIDFIAPDTKSLLEQADGRTVQLASGPQTLHVAGLAVRDYAPGWRTRFLGIITQPTIAYLLLIAGLYGLLLEAFHPGALFPGIAGAISLLIGLYALQLLPVNYAGLALMALGATLVVTEILTPTLGILGISGVAAFTLGSIMLFHDDGTGFGVNHGVIAGLAISAMLVLALLLWLVMRARRARLFQGDASWNGKTGELLEPLPANGEAWARIGGERWRVRNLGDAALPAGARVRVDHRENLLIWVVPA